MRKISFGPLKAIINILVEKWSLLLTYMSLLKAAHKINTKYTKNKIIKFSLGNYHRPLAVPRIQLGLKLWNQSCTVSVHSFMTRPSVKFGKDFSNSGLNILTCVSA